MVAVLRKDIRRFMMTERIMPRVWCTSEVDAGSRREKRAMHGTKEASKYEEVEVSTFNTYISPKNSCTYFGNSQSNKEVHKETSTPRRSVWGFVYPCASSNHGT